MLSPSTSLLAVLCGLLLGNVALQAGDTRLAKLAARPPRVTKVEPPTFTPEREAAALLFVRTHHVELADLVDGLRSRDQAEYERAIRELFQISEQLTVLRDKRPLMYDVELRTWQLRSRMQLLAARHAMNPDPALLAELQTLVEREWKLKLERLEIEEAELDLRREKIGQMIDTLQANREHYLRRQLELLVESAGHTSDEAGAVKPAADLRKRPLNEKAATEKPVNEKPVNEKPARKPAQNKTPASSTPVTP